MNTKKLFLPLILFVSFLLRLPSLFEPNWYGDEGVYQVIGQALREGRLLYAGIWDNKPPLLYIIYAIFDGDQFFVRFLFLVVMLLTIVSFFFLTRKIFKNEKVIYVATFIFAVLFATPFLEGNIANAENFMLLPIILAMYLIFSIKGHDDVKSYFLIGLLLSVAFLIKIVAIFDLGTLLMFLIVTPFLKDFRAWFKASALIIIGFILPILITILFFFLNGALKDFILATFSQNVTYVGIQGLLLLKLLILSVFCLTVFFKRNSLSKESIFIYLWLFFSVFNAFFGGRPWTHYLLTLLPAFCLFIGMLVEEKKFRLVNTVLFLIIITLIVKNFWIYGKTLSYYPNFIAFAQGTKNEEAYRNFFDWFVNRDYEIAAYIKDRTGLKDRIFVWGDNAQIYSLSHRLPLGRYTVSYHVTFYPNALLETKAAIEKEKPVYIIVIRDDFPEMFLGSKYVFRTEIRGAKIYARRI